jgi:1-aminocyclopropane-1-carboxylate deaminase
LITYQATPIQEIKDPAFATAGVRLLIKREDLNHPHISGNKWWKLKYNLELARAERKTTLLTFGGAYSNHLYAVAAAASELGWQSIGVVRGEATNPLNKTLGFATAQGMTLHYVSRTQYRQKNEKEFEDELRDLFGAFYLIPEGGTNAAAVRGCVEFGLHLNAEVAFDLLCLPVGTGGTIAGMVQSLTSNQRAVGFSVLKNGGFLEAEVRQWLPTHVPAQWRIDTRFDFGGYAKTTLSLQNFMAVQQRTRHLPLDPVYTGKTLFGIYEMIKSGEIPPSTTVLMIHTGGLQGA